MSFSVGIVGLPNVGKSTLFKALTRQQVALGPYPFTTINPNIGIVPVPDNRLRKIAKLIKPEKISPAVIEFVDIAGLVKGSHKGEGLGNQFLAQIRNCDAILEVVRAFEAPGVKNLAGNINPERDIEIIKIELELKDMEAKEKENLLSKKPIVYLLNTDGKAPYSKPRVKHLTINFRDEAEMTELSDSEKKELGIASQLDPIIKACYNILDLITFFTIARLKEARAWTLKRGFPALEAAGLVHSDFQKKFIKAEVVDWEKLIESGSWAKAKESGKVRTVSKDYIVQDGDVIEFKV